MLIYKKTGKLKVIDYNVRRRGDIRGRGNIEDRKKESS